MLNAHVLVAPHAGHEVQLLVPVIMGTMHQSEAASQAWASKWQDIPVHLLLPWAAQMLSLLDEPEGASFVPALQVRLAYASAL